MKKTGNYITASVPVTSVKLGHGHCLIGKHKNAKKGAIHMTTIIELVHTSDPYTGLKAGDRGLLKGRRKDPWGEVIDVAWDNGSTLSLVKGEDSWSERAPHPDDDFMYD